MRTAASTGKADGSAKESTGVLVAAPCAPATLPVTVPMVTATVAATDRLRKKLNGSSSR